MKLAFTTLGCPAWKLDQITRNAVKMGYGGIEFRGYLGDLNVLKMPEFGSDAARTARRFADAGLEVYCFATSAQAMCRTPEEIKACLDEVKGYVDLCAIFGTRMLRVYGGRIGDAPRDQAVEIAAEGLRRMAAVAAGTGVSLLVETHDDWTASDNLRALVETADCPEVAVLWDTHHPFRFSDEPPALTFKNLSRWIRATHWKDSNPIEGKKGAHKLCLMGDGDIPLRDILLTLVRGGYDGYLTFEWEKKWVPELEEPEIAFPQYAEYMRQLLAGIG